jgi:hypothetical protein
MSHVAQCVVVVRSLDVLESAAPRLGGVLRRNQNNFVWYGRFVDDSKTWKEFFTPERAAEIAAMDPTARKAIITKEMSRCDHVISFKGAKYEVGVLAQPDGTFRLRFDEYDYSLTAKIGSGGGKLAQAYALEAAKRAAKLKGWRSREVNQKGGAVKLEVYAA